MRIFLILAFIALTFTSAPPAFALDVPYLTGRVTDNAEILSPEMRRSLAGELKAHEDRTGNQIAILTVPSLEGASIEEYAHEVFEAWKLGQKGKDNGILIIVAPKDRRLRIEVGYGLEGTLPDSMAGSIIRDAMTPRFKANDFNGGIEAGVKAVITVLEGGKLPETDPGTKDKTPASSGLQIDGPDLSLTERILIGAFIFGIIGLFTVIGVLTPQGGWFLYAFLIPFWAMFPILVVGTTGALYLLITYLIGFPVAKLILRKSEWYQKAKEDLKTKGHASIGGFTIGSGGSGSSWSSGGSGSSGFSGGGGSSGGGGASGSW
jgi:uncharacterized protein